MGRLWTLLAQADGGFDFSSFNNVVTTLGPIAGWLMLGWAVFRYLMGHASNLQRDNINHLIEQRDEWKARAVTAEKAVAIYASAYGPPPSGEVSLSLIIEEVLEAAARQRHEGEDDDA